MNFLNKSGFLTNNTASCKKWCKWRISRLMEFLNFWIQFIFPYSTWKAGRLQSESFLSMKLPEHRISSFEKDPLSIQKYWSETQNMRPLVRKPTQRVFLPLIVRSLPQALEWGKTGPWPISGHFHHQGVPALQQCYSVGSTQPLPHKARSTQIFWTAGGWLGGPTAVWMGMGFFYGAVMDF